MALAGIATVAVQAQEYNGGNLTAVDHFVLGNADQHLHATATVTYDNTVNFTGFGFANGGAANLAGNTITKMVMDDLTPTGVSGDVTSFKFSVANFDAAAVTARARVRFWNADGTGGAPGTYYSVPAAVGFTFNPIAFAPGVTVFSAGIAPGTFTMPGTTFWAGITFDDNTGGTGATIGQMNNLGQGVFDPPVVGSSADQMFITAAAGSFFGTNNPAGGLANFGGQPHANFGWEFEVVPEPTTMAVLGMGLAGFLARRRKKA
jgi:hypothetical protein